MVIRYEDFVAAKKEVLNDVSLKLGLLPVAEIDSLLDVQYQPKGVKGRVSPVEFFSRQSLEKILDITDGFRQEFGYE